MKTAVLSLIISVLLIAAFVFQFDRYQKFEKHTQELLGTLSSNVIPELNLEKQAIQKLTENQQLIFKGFNNIQTEVIKNQQLEKPLIQNLSVNEAKYLIRLASIRLLMEKDANGAISLLNDASEILKNLNDPNFMTVRESIANDILAIQNLKMPNIETLWLQVTALINEIDNLPTQGLKSQEELRKSQTESEEENEETKSTWKEALKDTLHNLEGLVKIQKHTKPIEPILSAEEQILAKEWLHLLLQQVRFALLNNQEQIYQGSLLEIESLIKQHFELSNKKVEVFLSQIQELKNIELKVNFPTLESGRQFPQGQGQ